jgi:6-phosphogluconolactonase/glucosamine-6-phosphate isomerase/deaminase
MRTPGLPRLAIFRDESAAARALTDRIAVALAANPALELGLPTGRTPVAFYHELASRVEHGTSVLHLRERGQCG